jgi:hypothetical protein
MYITTIEKPLTRKQLISTKEYIKNMGLEMEIQTEKMNTKTLLVTFIINQKFSKKLCEFMAYIWNQDSKMKTSTKRIL